MSRCRLNIRLHAMLKLLLMYASICTSASLKYSHYVTELIDKLPTEYCPYTKYCQSNATYNLRGQKQTACCQACTCEENCWDRGTCCPDMKSDTTKPRTEFCRSPTVKRLKHHSHTENGYGYYVVTDCPSTEKNKYLVQKCAGVSRERYEDFVWVSDTVTNKIYNNKFCAECNGVQQYKGWYLTTDCPQILKGDYSLTDTKLVPGRCLLTVVPPDVDVDVATNRCDLSVISKCNHTSRWQIFDRGLVEACMAFEQHYLVEHLFGTSIYRNVFCYLCNKDFGTTIKNVCKLTDRSRSDGGPVVTTLLDHTFFKDPEEASDYPCAINEVLDPFQVRCRRLTCPIFSAPFYGSCRRIASETYLLGFIIVYRLDPVWELSTFIWNDDSNTTLMELGEAIYKAINKKIGLLDVNCETCLQNVGGSHQLQYTENFIQGFPEYFTFSADFIPGKYCDDDFIIQRLLVLRDTNLAVKLNNRQMITFAIHIDKRSIKKVGRLTRTIFSDFRQCAAMHSMINLAEAKVCPTVTLTRDDYFALINITVNASQRANVNTLFGYTGDIISEIPADLNKMTYACLESYKSVLAAYSGAPVPKVHAIVWVICVITLYHI